MGFSHETLHFSGSWPSSRLRGTTDPPRSPPPRCSQRLGALGSGLGCHGFPRENHGKTMGEMGKSFTGRGILHGYVKGWCEMTFGKKGKAWKSWIHIQSRNNGRILLIKLIHANPNNVRWTRKCTCTWGREGQGPQEDQKASAQNNPGPRHPHGVEKLNGKRSLVVPLG